MEKSGENPTERTTSKVDTGAVSLGDRNADTLIQEVEKAAKAEGLDTLQALKSAQSKIESAITAHEIIQYFKINPQKVEVFESK